MRSIEYTNRATLGLHGFFAPDLHNFRQTLDKYIEA